MFLSLPTTTLWIPWISCPEASSTSPPPWVRVPVDLAEQPWQQLQGGDWLHQHRGRRTWPGGGWDPTDPQTLGLFRVVIWRIFLMEDAPFKGNPTRTMFGGEPWRKSEKTLSETCVARSIARYMAFMAESMCWKGLTFFNFPRKWRVWTWLLKSNYWMFSYTYTIKYVEIYWWRWFSDLDQ